jgi:hypothetical protein
MRARRREHLGIAHIRRREQRLMQTAANGASSDALQKSSS